MRLFFVTDIHGSDLCFRKFLRTPEFYGAEAIIVGGDITGKRMIPIVPRGSGFEAQWGSEKTVLESEAAVADFERKVADYGYYPARMATDEAETVLSDRELFEARFESLIAERLERWMDLADQHLPKHVQCYMSAGNDDPACVDGILDRAPRVQNTFLRRVELPDGRAMIGVGYANLTPWHCPRDVPEDELWEAIRTLAEGLADPHRAIFNFHCPPYDSGLDTAPNLDENLRPKMVGASESAPVGSTAVRRAIETYQPALSLHGHIHESKAFRRFGQSVALNPGSEYSEGVLRGVIVDIDRKGKVTFTFTQG